VRYKMGIGMVPLTMVFASCSYFSGADACVVDESERPATVLTEPELEEASQGQANVYMDVTSASESPVRPGPAPIHPRRHWNR
jgi:hypothetical protein